MEALTLLFRIAWRNLFSSRMNLIIGVLIFLGTVLLVVGGAILGSVDSAMSRSIIGSVAGHIQVYSARSKGELSLFGAMGAEPVLSAFDDFSRLKKTLESVDNVQTVVPMGINGAQVPSGNTLDRALAALRELERDRAAGKGGPEGAARIESLKAHVRHMVDLLRDDSKNLTTLVDEKALDKEALAALERASSDEFWAAFDSGPLDSLEFLENRVAELEGESDLLYLRYVGTDLDAFQKAFDRMEIVDGQPVPAGQRGLLISKFVYEESVKLRTARRLDHIRDAITRQGRRIAIDPELQRWVKENQAQTREILFQLDPLRNRQAVERLQRALGSPETDLRKLLVTLFTTDDANFASRYQIFYEQIAPLLELYRIKPGDVLTIRATTQTGSVESIDVRVFGTFQFKGLERSAVAGSLSLMDMMSFRDLYGYLTADKRAEIERMKREVGARSVDRARAEADLFAGNRSVVADASPGIIDDASLLRDGARASRHEELARRIYSKEEIEAGMVLNAAVFLKDPARLEQTLFEIAKAGERDGLPLKPVSWQRASGMVGQLVLMAKLVLYFSVFIIFVVTMVIINNAMVMTTLQRTREIGTLRAIGAQRGFVRAMVLIETSLLGLLFGAAGALAGSGVVRLAARNGISAPSDTFYFFFSGPKLYPTLSAGTWIGALVIILLVSAASTFYPAALATRVSPVTAIRADE